MKRLGMFIPKLPHAGWPGLIGPSGCMVGRRIAIKEPVFQLSVIQVLVLMCWDLQQGNFLGTDFVCESNQFMKQVGVLTVVIHQDTIVHMLLVE
jgi:hypothetical protein